MIQKIKLLILLGGLCGCLCACEGETMTQADKYWVDAQSANCLEDYLAEEGEYLDWETVQREAGNEALSMQQQFRIVSLLCTYEYQCLSEADDTQSSRYQQLVGEDELKMFRMEYPDSAPYANAYLKKVNTQKDEFWKSFEVIFDLGDYLEALIAAAGELDGQTVFNLLDGLNENDIWGIKFKDALIKWIKVHPEEMVAYIDVLAEKGVFEDWGIYEWQRVFLYNNYAPYEINTATTDDGLSYISSVREKLIPHLGSEFESAFEQRSELEEGYYYNTMLTVGVNETFDVDAALEVKRPEKIALEGKKVIAFYRNPNANEFEGSPTTLRILGDFMVGLSEEEYPKTAAEADYYLVLTAFYEYGGTYQSVFGREMPIQWVTSWTPVDLYEAKTGQFLGRIGTLLETSPDTMDIWRDEEKESIIYPELVLSDVLLYIYHNMNEPEKYAYLLDSIPENAGWN